jgi:hypothetical protein
MDRTSFEGGSARVTVVVPYHSAVKRWAEGRRQTREIQMIGRVVAASCNQGQDREARVAVSIDGSRERRDGVEGLERL